MTVSLISRWRYAVGPVLLGSLMVNLFLVGGVLGDRFAPEPAPPPLLMTERPLAENAAGSGASADPAPASRSRLAGQMRDVIAQLPPEERRAVNSAFAQRRQQLRAERDGVLAARARARELMGAEPFDAAALAAALAELRAATTTLQTTNHRVLLETAPNLTAETRRKFAEVRRVQ
jgi:uncharacterized membrane protein